MEKLLPVHYFLLTITLPRGLRDVARSHQRIVYIALFSCAQEALKKLARDKRFIGSTRIGYLAVLHTWGSMLQYHPHLHLVIPGGAVSEKGDEWLSSRQDLFVHTKPLALIFKAKFREAMKKAKLLDKSILRFGNSISNNRIKSIEDDAIKFTYKDRDKNRWKTMSLEPLEFIRRFLQHILPNGFMKIRHYGFLNPNSSYTIDRLRELISLIQDVIRDLSPETPEYKNREIKCTCCGNPLRFIAFLKPLPRWGLSG